MAVSRIENGTRVVGVEDVAAILGALSTSVAEREQVLAIAREAESPNWSVIGSPGVPTQLTALVAYEREARSITEVNPLLVPGLLQSREYARAIVGSGTANAEELEQRVNYRLARQDVLTGRNAPHYLAIITESVLRIPVGGHLAMAEQCIRLLSMVERSNVDIQVIPDRAGAHVGLAGEFVYIESDHSPPVAHLEHLSASALVTKPRDLVVFQRAVDTLRTVSMSTNESIELIRLFATHHESESS